jgi:hypothetical protein
MSQGNSKTSGSIVNYVCENLAPWLAKTGSVVAGSCALKMYLDKEGIGGLFVMSPGDVDIWTPAGPKDKALIADLLDFRFRTIYDAKLDLRKGYQRLKRIVSNTWTSNRYDTGDHQLQCMILQPQVTVKQAIASFDLTVCQVWFDGQHVSATDAAKEDIQNKTMHITQAAMEQTLSEWFRTLTRISKYRNRGFTLEDTKSVSDAVTTAMKEFGGGKAKTWDLEKMGMHVRCLGLAKYFPDLCRALVDSPTESLVFSNEFSGPELYLSPTCSDNDE